MEEAGARQSTVPLPVPDMDFDNDALVPRLLSRHEDLVRDVRNNLRPPDCRSAWAELDMH